LREKKRTGGCKWGAQKAWEIGLENQVIPSGGGKKRLDAPGKSTRMGEKKGKKTKLTSSVGKSMSRGGPNKHENERAKRNRKPKEFLIQIKKQ